MLFNIWLQLATLIYFEFYIILIDFFFLSIFLQYAILKQALNSNLSRTCTYMIEFGECPHSC